MDTRLLRDSRGRGWKPEPVSAALVVTIDTVAPAEPSLELDPASDTAPVGDGETTAASVTLVGQAEPGSRSAPGGHGPDSGRGRCGPFRSPACPWPWGHRSFTVRATDLAGNSTAFSRTITRVSAIPRQDAVLSGTT